jgi:hypothetical protein
VIGVTLSIYSTAFVPDDSSTPSHFPQVVAGQIASHYSFQETAGSIS